jgi:hypothetical protein
MDTPIKWNSSSSREMARVARPKWEEVRQGLLLAVAGHFCLLLFGAPAAYLFGPHGVDTVLEMGLSSEDAVDLGWLAVGLAGLLGYGLVVAGQWRCLIYAPQGYGAKELLFAGILCSLTAPVALASAYLLRKADVAVMRGVGMLPLTVALLVVLSALLFTGFAEAVTRSVRETRRARGALWFYWAVGFLVGGTVGVHLIPALYFRDDVRLPLGLCWVICLLWHTLLIYQASRCVSQAMRQSRSGVHAPVRPGEAVKGQVALKAASYLGEPEPSMPPPVRSSAVEIADALFFQRAPNGPAS